MSEESDLRIGGHSLSGIMRRVRRIADFSQRDLARFAHVSPSTIAGIESGSAAPSLRALQNILRAANFQLVVVDMDGRLVVPL